MVLSPTSGTLFQTPGMTHLGTSCCCQRCVVPLVRARSESAESRRLIEPTHPLQSAVCGYVDIIPGRTRKQVGCPFITNSNADRKRLLRNDSEMYPVVFPRCHSLPLCRSGWISIILRPKSQMEVLLIPQSNFTRRDQGFGSEEKNTGARVNCTGGLLW